MKISIIVPVYNVEDYIEECIRSLLNQTIDDFEIIIVNDGSNDKSIEIIKKIKDNRIRIINKSNEGLSAARNTGIKFAQGKYIAFVDSDDFIGINSAYDDMYNIAIKERSDIVAGNCIWYYSNNNNYPLQRDTDMFANRNMSGEEFFKASLKSNRIYAPVWLNLYKLEFLRKNNLLFKEGIYREDEEFTPRSLIKANIVSIYNEDFYIYRQRKGSITKMVNKKKCFDIFAICLDLEREIININDNELVMLFRNYIASLAISSIYENRIKKIPSEIKKMISRNANKKTTMIKSAILQISPKVYLSIEFLYRKLLLKDSINKLDDIFNN